ncbi:MAG TPA: coenzyme F420-0:L-glutamate ligase [Conexibacter sp.]|nr:coenzyme F420-0:L-glutamate ligase [Conexibacter sp.]
MLTARALDGLPEVGAGDDLGALIAAALPGDAPLRDHDVVVVAHKVVSKAEGRVRRLDEVEPGPRAVELAAAHGKDPRHVQVVLDESRELLRASRGVLICVTHHGFVCANAGVDASNTAAREPESLILLPADPDASARALRTRLRELTGAAPAVVITDSFGRAWRHGQTDVAIGAAGIAPLEDWRGRSDSVGRELQATWIALADQIAGAADLARSKDSRQPVVVVSGLDHHVLPPGDDGPGAAALLRDAAEDLFR